MELLAEDQVVGAGATPNATVSTGGQTIWLMSTVLFKPASSAPPTVPGAPAGVVATAGNGSATVSWTAPPSGGSPITLYTVTPYQGGTALAPTTVSGSPPATSALVSGLTNRSPHTLTVSATNAVGARPAAPASAAVTPTAAPAPAVVH